jgi:peptidoglycan/LPS O-acetylase OafA/YrhL
VVCDEWSTAEIAGVDPAREQGRLAWLDALRGIGALSVALFHGMSYYLKDARGPVSEWVDPGTYGVLVFFLVSGYIIPASLERTGSLRRFWTGRLFRIYPLLGFVTAAIVLLSTAGLVPWREQLGTYSPWSAVAAHLTMLQDQLAVPSALNVLWTLSYEMAFYLLVAALFTVNLHRRSTAVALIFAALSLALGGLLPVAALSHQFGTGRTVACAAAVLLAAVTAACSASAATQRVTALSGGALALILISVNGRVAPWQGLIILAAMFTGTVIYRADQGQLSERKAAIVAGAVLCAAVITGIWHIGEAGGDVLVYQRNWAVTVMLTALTFGVAYALRRHRPPHWLTWLGVISYSVYLVHPLLLVISDLFIGRRHHDVVFLLGYLAVLLALSALTHHLIEQPAQRLGRRLSRAAPTSRADLDRRSAALRTQVRPVQENSGSSAVS